MTTAKTSVTEGGKAVGPFARGEGRVDLTKAALAGLVMNEKARGLGLTITPSRFTLASGATASDVDLYVGRDANNDGKPSEDEEVCRSATEAVLESCSVPNPDGGKYWVLVQDFLTGSGLDTVDLAVAIVPGSDTGDFKAIGPLGGALAGQPFDLTLAWNEPRLAVGESWFALVEYGSDSAHPTNAGSVLVKLTRVSG